MLRILQALGEFLEHVWLCRFCHDLYADELQEPCLAKIRVDHGIPTLVVLFFFTNRYGFGLMAYFDLVFNFDHSKFRQQDRVQTCPEQSKADNATFAFYINLVGIGSVR